MKQNTVMLAVAFDLYREPKSYITKILTISLAFKLAACNTLFFIRISKF